MPPRTSRDLLMVDRRLTLTRINDQIRTVVAITFRVCEKLYTPVIRERCQHTAIPTMALSVLPNGLRERIRFPHGSSPLIDIQCVTRQPLALSMTLCRTPVAGQDLCQSVLSAQREDKQLNNQGCHAQSRG